MARRLLAIVLVMVLSFVWITPSYGQNVVKKLGRGVANIATCFLEVPIQIMKETREEGDIQGLFVGGAKGMFNMVGRLFTGVYETVTFLVPIPADYAPIFEPEFVYEGEAAAF